MANVRRYTEQIASAKKGKDVRAAIVSAINEVSDENNTYNQTKADIQAAQKSINADVTKNQQTQQAFNSNLQEAKEVQKDLTAKMNKGTTPVSYTHLDVYKRQVPGHPGMVVGNLAAGG